VKKPTFDDYIHIREKIEVTKRNSRLRKVSWLWGYMSIIPATQKVEIGRKAQANN
jgi:hypothetical protein